jgi:hypothetical protein
MHPGTNMVATYLGQTWWDNESDGKFMYPADHQIEPIQAEEVRKLNINPEGAVVARALVRFSFLTDDRHRPF